MILSICFILINMAIVNADVPIRIKLNDVETKKGAEFKVNLSLENNTGIAGLTLKLKFDKNVIKPISFQNKASEFTALTNINSPDIDLDNIDTIDVTFDSTNNVTINGNIGIFTFAVLDNANISETTISIVSNKGDVFDSSLNDIDYITVNSNISIKDFSWGKIYGDADVDNRLTSNDASVVLQKVLDKNFKMPLEDVIKNYKEYVDVDNDNLLTAKDSSMILQKVLDSNFIMTVER